MKLADVDRLFHKFGEVLTPRQVAETIVASDDYICGLINKGELPCFCVGTHFRVLKTDVIACLKRSVPPVPLDSVLQEPPAP